MDSDRQVTISGDPKVPLDPSVTVEPASGRPPDDFRVAEHERQFRELLEYCPAALSIVDEEGRLVFHNARLHEGALVAAGVLDPTQLLALSSVEVG